MDVQYLKEDEILYELKVRQMDIREPFNYRQDLSARLIQEKEDPDLRPVNLVRVDVGIELIVCDKKLSEIERVLSAPVNSGSRFVVLAYRSSFLHVDTRLLRLSPKTEDEAKKHHDLLQKIKLMKEHYYPELLRQTFSAAPSVDDRIKKLREECEQLERQRLIQSFQEEPRLIDIIDEEPERNARPQGESTRRNTSLPLVSTIPLIPQSNTEMPKRNVTMEDLAGIVESLKSQIATQSSLSSKTNAHREPQTTNGLAWNGQQYSMHQMNEIDNVINPFHGTFGENFTAMNAAVNEMASPRPQFGRQMNNGSQGSLRAGQNNLTGRLGKWRTTFDGRKDNLFRFINKIEYLARAEDVSDEELLTGGIVLFTGQGLDWFLANRGSCRNWSDLINSLKGDFLGNNYDYWLEAKIDARMQGAGEPLHQYLADMKVMNMNLSVEKPEYNVVQTIIRNMHPVFANKIPPCSVLNMKQLEIVCRALETSRANVVRFNKLSKTSANVHAIEENFYQENGEGEGEEFEDLAALRTFNRNGRRPEVKDTQESICWNCGAKGHSFGNCREQKRRFCYGCGLKDVIVTECPNCIKN